MRKNVTCLNQLINFRLRSNIRLNGKIIKIAVNVKYLGVTSDKNLTFESHSTNIKNKIIISIAHI